MIAFDTNLLIRYLTGDDEAQCRKIDALIDAHNAEGAIFISDVVLVEVEWVLRSVYEFPRSRILDALDRIASTAQFSFRDKETLWRALKKYRDGNRDFSDCLIGEEGRRVGARTYTFDKKLKNDRNFTVL